MRLTTINLVAKNTSTAESPGPAAAQRRIRAAEKQAAKILADAEELARGLVLDARATAEGVRAEGMELVSMLRQTSDALRASADMLQSDIDRIHAWMVGELERVEPGGAGGSSPIQRGRDSDPEPREAAVEAAISDEQLDVPDFVARR